MNLRERSKKRRKERLLAAARDILIQDGADALQMRAVAERAELSVRTLYNYFGKKSEVITALAAAALRDVAADLDEVGADDDGLQLSRATITISIERFHAQRDLLRPLLAAAYAGGAAEGGEMLVDMALALQESALELAMRSGQLLRVTPARHISYQIITAYNQAALRWSHGEIDERGFVTQALHGWACLLLGFARGDTRAHLMAELAGLQEAMTELVLPRRSSHRAAAPAQ